MIQYISWKDVKVTGKNMRLYLSMSEAVIPNILFRSFTLHSGFAGGGSLVLLPPTGGIPGADPPEFP